MSFGEYESDYDVVDSVYKTILHETEYPDLQKDSFKFDEDFEEWEKEDEKKEK